MNFQDGWLLAHPPGLRQKLGSLKQSPDGLFPPPAGSLPLDPSDRFKATPRCVYPKLVDLLKLTNRKLREEDPLKDSANPQFSRRDWVPASWVPHLLCMGSFSLCHIVFPRPDKSLKPDWFCCPLLCLRFPSAGTHCIQDLSCLLILQQTDKTQSQPLYGDKPRHLQ